MPSESREAATDGSIEAANETLVRAHFEAINDRDLDRAADLHADDVRFHSLGRTIDGFEAVRGSWRAQLEAVPDLEDAIEALIADGDTVAVRYTTTGTHEGDLLGIEGTGQSVEVTSMAMLRVEDGEIAEWWNYPDVTGLLRQLDGIESPIP